MEAFTSEAPIRKDPEQSIHQSHVGSHDSISRRQTIRETRVHEDLNEQLAEIEAQKREEEIEADRQKALRDAQSDRLKEQAKRQANMALTEIALEEEEQKEKESGDANYRPWSFYDPGGPTTKQKKHAAEMQVRRQEEKIRQQRTSSTTRHAPGQTAVCAVTAGPSAHGRMLLPNTLGLAGPHKLSTREQRCHAPSHQQQQLPHVPSGNQGPELSEGELAAVLDQIRRLEMNAERDAKERQALAEFAKSAKGTPSPYRQPHAEQMLHVSPPPRRSYTPQSVMAS